MNLVNHRLNAGRAITLCWMANNPRRKKLIISEGITEATSPESIVLGTNILPTKPMAANRGNTELGSLYTDRGANVNIQHDQGWYRYRRRLAGVQRTVIAHDDNVSKGASDIDTNSGHRIKYSISYRLKVQPQEMVIKAPVVEQK